MRPTAPPPPALADLDFTKPLPPEPAEKPPPDTKILQALQREVKIGTGELGESGYYVSFARKRKPAATPRTGQARVVCCEDDPTTRKSLEKLLGLAGYGIVAVGSGKELAAVLRSPPLPDAIILDVGLPDANGFDIVRRLRAHEHFKDIPIVMFTGHGETEDIMRGLILGVDAYITKPATLETLRSTLASILG